MSAMSAVGLYVGINLILLIWFSLNVGAGRINNKINLGDGGNDDMYRRIRAQGNFIEYAPLALIGLFMLAMLGAPVMLIHGLGIFFIIVRLLHFSELGLSTFEKGRLFGAVGTMLTLLVTAVSLMFFAFTGSA